MKPYSPSPTVAIAIIATQLLGPAALWASEERGIRFNANRQVIVSALSGRQLTLQGETGTKALQFHEVLAEGTRLSTGAGTTAELLIGNRAVVTLASETTAQVRTVNADQTTIQITNGSVRVAAAASAVGPQGLVTVQTPTSQVQTRGGIVRVLVEAPVGKAEHIPTGAQAYRASYTPETMTAAATPPNDIIQVEEGTAEVPGVGSTGGSLAMKAGQRVIIQAGRAGAPVEVGNSGLTLAGIAATMGHVQTPKEGRDYLVALQVDQATQLSKALTGTSETGGGESDKKTDTKNVINGATGGGVGAGLVSALFGGGNPANPSASKSLDTTGNGYGGLNNNSNFSQGTIPTSFFLNNSNSLLTFTRKDPVGELSPGSGKVQSLDSLVSNFIIRKELVLVGGTPNEGHGGIAPTERLIIRGLANGGVFGPLAPSVTVTNNDFVPTDSRPADTGSTGGGIANVKIEAANNTFVVEGEKNYPSVVDRIKIPDGIGGQEVAVRLGGGTLGQYSGYSDKRGIAFVQPGDPIRPHDIDNGSHEISLVEGAITATTAPDRPTILKSGVALDQGTIATIGRTDATSTYFDPKTNPDLSKLKNEDARFSGSLLSIIRRPNSVPTVLTMQDRMLGVYDGSTVCVGTPKCDESADGNKALLSVLDAKLKGPGSSIPLIDIAAGKHFTVDNSKEKPEIVKTNSSSPPNVTVTSALVTRSTINLNVDGALLEASAPIFALTQANMMTRSHFADLAGNEAQSLNLNGAMVALSGSKLMIDSGHLLNVNNATAGISGYLFSLNNGSTLQLNNGALFSLTNNSSLTLTGNAFGVFGNGTNTLSIQNHLCGAGGTCGFLVDSAGHKMTTLDGTVLKVAGVTQNVALPNGFNVFALTQQTNKPTITIGADAALFKVDPTSHLTIKVQ